MGGGKTHNMIAAGLLAQHPEVRKEVIGDLYNAKSLGELLPSVVGNNSAQAHSNFYTTCAWKFPSVVAA